VPGVIDSWADLRAIGVGAAVGVGVAVGLGDGVGPIPVGVAVARDGDGDALELAQPTRRAAVARTLSARMMGVRIEGLLPG
jgi:hypothetical protein